MPRQDEANRRLLWRLLQDVGPTIEIAALKYGATINAVGDATANTKEDEGTIRETYYGQSKSAEDAREDWIEYELIGSEVIEGEVVSVVEEEEEDEL